MFKSRFLLIFFLSIVFLSCEKKSDNVIDPVYVSPLLSNLKIIPDTISTNSTNPSINFFTSVKILTNGGSEIKTASLKIFSPDNTQMGLFELRDNGILPDSIKGDNIYSCNISINISGCLVVGNYLIQYSAENKDGILSNQISYSLPVRNINNLPPNLTNPNLPDSVVRPVSGFFDITISVDAIDPDGSCDINEVFFNAYRPTGSFIGKFLMSKTSGNTYNFTNSVFPSTADSTYGYYKYNFYAIDRSNAQSNVLIDSIKFVRP